MKQIDRIKKLKETHKSSLLSIDSVQGVAVGLKFKDGKPTSEVVLQVFVDKKSDKPTTPIPATYTMEDGTVVKTDVIELGLLKFTGFTGKYRPAKPGAVIGHYQAQLDGTFGALVTDNTDGDDVIVSAGHILSNFNNANIGDPILQPGPQHGGTTQQDSYATLKRFIPLNLQQGGVNYVDVGIATPDSTKKNWIRDSSFCSPIKVTRQCAVGLMWSAGSAWSVINPIAEVMSQINVSFGKTIDASLNMSVHCCGAHTGYVQTQIASIHADLQIEYEGNTISFLDQILAPGNIADAANGDSGAIFYTTFNC